MEEMKYQKDHCIAGRGGGEEYTLGLKVEGGGGGCDGVRRGYQEVRRG